MRGLCLPRLIVTGAKGRPSWAAALQHQYHHYPNEIVPATGYGGSKGRGKGGGHRKGPVDCFGLGECAGPR